MRSGLCLALVGLACALSPSVSDASRSAVRAEQPAFAGPSTTPTLPPGPELGIVGVHILHLVKGKEANTQRLVTGEFAEFLVQYRAIGVSNITPTLNVTKNGKQLGSILLQPVTYAGQPSGGWILAFTKSAGTGTFYAHFRVTASGGHSVKRDRKFFVTLH